MPSSTACNASLLSKVQSVKSSAIKALTLTHGHSQQSTPHLNSPDTLEPLTSNHMIQMKSSTAVPPPGTFPKEDLYGAKRWRCMQFLAQQFWCCWKKEYLTTRRVKISVGDKRLNKKGKRHGKLSILEHPAQNLILLLEAS